MIKYLRYCDRCGNEIEFGGGRYGCCIGGVPKRPRDLRIINHDIGDNSEIDLCDKCKESFLVWWKESSEVWE